MSQEVIAGRQSGVQHLELGLDLLLDGLEGLRKARATLSKTEG